MLGAHFRDVAAALQQFLVGHVAPMAECDPGMVSQQPRARGAHTWFVQFCFRGALKRGCTSAVCVELVRGCIGRGPRPVCQMACVANPLVLCVSCQVRRLCSTLVTGRPCAGQECSVHEDQVCFIQVRVQLWLVGGVRGVGMGEQGC